MPSVTTCVPARQPKLVSWRAGYNGHYLVRNRSTGETFQFGEQEHFLLDGLHGRQSSEEICRAFAERFSEPLSAEDLYDFVELAAQRGLMQSLDGEIRPEHHTTPSRVGEEHGSPNEAAATSDPHSVPGTLYSELSTPWKLVAASPRRLRWSWSSRTLSRSMRLVSAGLRWPANLLSAAASRLDTLRLRRVDFIPRPDDVFIVTYPRSGTTWLQMILYQLTTDGNMDFPHIAEYCPWFERSVRSARAFETRPSPRLFKSHLPCRKIPKGPCKYIYVARDGRDVAVSCYHLVRSYNGYSGTFGEFFSEFLRGKVEFGSWFSHVRGWWEERNSPNVLFLTYEELNRKLADSISKIANFLGHELPPAKLATVVERSSFAFMKLHEQKFDPALEMLWEEGVQLKSFLRNGKTGDGAAELNSDQRAQFNAIVQKLLGPLNIPIDEENLAGMS